MTSRACENGRSVNLEENVPVMLITANVGSLFEALDDFFKSASSPPPSTGYCPLLDVWLAEIEKYVSSKKPLFFALHMQEYGGKLPEVGIKHSDFFLSELKNRFQGEYSRSRAFVDTNYEHKELFSALGCVYFMHKRLDDVFIYDFDERHFEKVESHAIYQGGQLMALPADRARVISVMQLVKPPLSYFPNHKSSRKGYLRTRWQIKGQLFDLVNVHLFHDADNLVAVDKRPSLYAEYRKEGLDFMLRKLGQNEPSGVPMFLFGDFNFRLDTRAVVHHLLGTSTYQNSIHNSKLQLGQKKFRPADMTVFAPNSNYTQFHSFDYELSRFASLSELPVTFSPTYPFCEQLDEPTAYNDTRCPSWCDRVLFNEPARSALLMNQLASQYDSVGKDACMGDHKPVALFFEMLV